MATRGAQPGNSNAANKDKPWQAAIKRALSKRSRVAQMEALDAIAEKFLELCDEKDMAAIRELGDRLDGKAAQAITGADGGPISISIIEALKEARDRIELDADK